LAEITLSKEEKKGFIGYSTKNIIVYYITVAAWSAVMFDLGQLKHRIAGLNPV
jgi:hypothetical protein